MIGRSMIDKATLNEMVLVVQPDDGSNLNQLSAFRFQLSSFIIFHALFLRRFLTYIMDSDFP
jgi:hypothetical protein